MQEIKTCPICSSKTWESVFEVTDHAISKESFQLKKCWECELVVTSPQPEADKLSRFYQSDNYISHSGKSNNIINSVYLQARKISLGWKQNIIANQQSIGSILDVGCGTGEFLQRMKSSGWQVSGIEPIDTARKKAAQILNQTIHESLENTIGEFDVITLWHVLEHLPNLNESMEKIHKLLKPKGSLIIAVPNHNSQDAKTYKKFWAAYDTPRHLWHFNKSAMSRLLQNHKFIQEKILPMKLDSYYVSLLSEKYKHNGQMGLEGTVNAILNGLLSNLKAKKSGEYSSLIYVATK